MKEIGRFNRAVIPEDVVNLDVQTLDFGDANQSMVCSCVYIRFNWKDGTYSYQLILARSRIVLKDMTLPRAELYASLLDETLVRLSVDHSRISTLNHLSSLTVKLACFGSPTMK